MADQSELYVEKSPLVRDGLRELVTERLPGLGIEVFLVPFGPGARAHLTRLQGKKVHPISTACTSDLNRPVKDIVHGLWGCLVMRGTDEIKHLKKETGRIPKLMK
jgi:hypothetical protein